MYLGCSHSHFVETKTRSYPCKARNLVINSKTIAQHEPEVLGDFLGEGVQPTEETVTGTFPDLLQTLPAVSRAFGPGVLDQMGEKKGAVG